MRRIRVSLREDMIEPEFGRRERIVRDRNPQSVKARPPNGDKECLRGFDPRLKILDPATDEIASRQHAVVHRY